MNIHEGKDYRKVLGICNKYQNLMYRLIAVWSTFVHVFCRYVPLGTIWKCGLY